MRPLRAEPRLILEIYPDVPIGRDEVLVVRARHEVAVAEAMQQVVDGLAAHQHPELL
jgi:hypothetical protein